MVSALVPRASGPGSGPGGHFSKAPETFRARIKSHCKISNLAITELFYSHILKMKGGSLHTRSFERIHFPVIRYRSFKRFHFSVFRYR